jgi:hypothetical protein
MRTSWQAPRIRLKRTEVIDPEGDKVEDVASPYIDLDSVYGQRSKLSKRPDAIFDGHKFKHDMSTNVRDLPRSAVADGAEFVNVPAIFDARNDENQMILQIHILMERLHNKFIDTGSDFDTARRNTILNWQSFLIHEYLPALLLPKTLAELRTIVDSGNFNQLRVAKQSPKGTWYIQMPHEFSIGFRMGHSQLRPAYKVQSASGPVTLFDPGYLER